MAALIANYTGESSPQRESTPERWLEWEAENNPGFQLKGVSGTRFRESNLERERSKDRTRRRVPGAPGGFRTLRAEGSGGPRSFYSLGPPASGRIVKLLYLVLEAPQGSSLREKRSQHNTEESSDGVAHGFRSKRSK